MLIGNEWAFHDEHIGGAIYDADLFVIEVDRGSGEYGKGTDRYEMDHGVWDVKCIFEDNVCPS